MATEPQKFRKKPVEIEAMQVTDGQSLDDIYSWITDNGGACTVHQTESGRPVVHVKTLEGTMQGGYRDWIIRRVQGEFYPCKPDIFEATYDLVESARAEAAKTTVRVSIAHLTDGREIHAEPVLLTPKDLEQMAGSTERIAEVVASSEGCVHLELGDGKQVIIPTRNVSHLEFQDFPEEVRA